MNHDIPPEFMSSARDVMRVARRASYGRATEMIAQMLKGERERAARIAEEFESDADPDAGTIIAQAIRRGE